MRRAGDGCGRAARPIGARRGERSGRDGLAGRAAALPLYGAALRADTRDARQTDLSRGVILIGSEGRGLSAAALSACTATVRIPMAERCESLNAAVAAAVLLWEGYR